MMRYVVLLLVFMPLVAAAPCDTIQMAHPFCADCVIESTDVLIVSENPWSVSANPGTRVLIDYVYEFGDGGVLSLIPDGDSYDVSLNNVDVSLWPLCPQAVVKESEVVLEDNIVPVSEIKKALEGHGEESSETNVRSPYEILKITPANVEDAHLDVLIEKTVTGDVIVVILIPQKNLDSLSYAEVGSQVVYGKEYVKIRRNDPIKETFMTKNPSKSIVFNKKVTRWDFYLLTVLVLIFCLALYSAQYQQHHKKYMYVVRNDPWLKHIAHLPLLMSKAKISGLAFFTFIVSYILTPLIDIFTAQFVSTVFLVVYTFYVGRMHYDIEGAE